MGPNGPVRVGERVRDGSFAVVVAPREATEEEACARMFRDEPVKLLVAARKVNIDCDL